MIRPALLLSFGLMNLYMNGQDRHIIDSLKKNLSRATTDKARIENLAVLAFEYVHQSPDTCIRYANEGLILSRKTNHKSGEIMCLLRLGAGMATLRNYANSLQFLLQALQESEHAGFQMGINFSLNNLGDTYFEIGDEYRSILYAKKALPQPNGTMIN